MENVGDPEIEELKEIVKRQGEVIDETNRMMHSMRRGQRWRLFWTLLWWAAIIAVSYGTYYYYLQPYIGRLEQAYAGFQQQTHNAQTLEQKVADWFKQFGGSASSTKAQ